MVTDGWQATAASLPEGGGKANPTEYVPMRFFWLRARSLAASLIKLHWPITSVSPWPLSIPVTLIG